MLIMASNISVQSVNNYAWNEIVYRYFQTHTHSSDLFAAYRNDIVI